MRRHCRIVGAALLAAVLAGCGSAVPTNELARANSENIELALREVEGTLGSGTNPEAGPSPEAGATDERGTQPDSSASPGAAAVAVPAAGATTAVPGKSGAGPATPGAATAGTPGRATATTAPRATPGAAPAAGTAVPTPGARGTAVKGEIRLGSLGVQTGPLGAVMQPLLNAAQAWVADVNSRGGAAGHPVRLVLGDDAGDPNRSLALVRRMVEQDRVHAFYAERMPTTLQAVTPYLEEKRIPVIGANYGNPVIDTSPMIFQVGVGAKEGTLWSHLLPVLKMTDKRKMALLYCREVQTCSVLQDGIKKLAGQVGITIVYNAQVSIAQPDYTAEMLAARNAGADVVLWIGDVPTIIRMARSAHRQNYSPTFAGPHSMPDDRMIKDGGADIEGLVAPNAIVPYATSPKLADYRAAVPRFVPGGVLSSMGSGSWAAGKMIEALAKSFGDGEPTPADFLKALYGLRGETLGGLVPPTAYEQDKGHEKSNQCVTLVKVERQRWVPFQGDEFVCAPGWKPVGS